MLSLIDDSEGALVGALPFPLDLRKPRLAVLLAVGQGYIRDEPRDFGILAGGHDRREISLAWRSEQELTRTDFHRPQPTSGALRPGRTTAHCRCRRGGALSGTALGPTAASYWKLEDRSGRHAGETASPGHL